MKNILGKIKTALKIKSKNVDLKTAFENLETENKKAEKEYGEKFFPE